MSGSDTEIAELKARVERQGELIALMSDLLLMQSDQLSRVLDMLLRVRELILSGEHEQKTFLQ